MASSLYLDILNLTIGESGKASDGFTASDIHLVIQGRIGKGDGPYAHFDWGSSTFEAMSTKDNTVTIDALGVDPNIKYAPYGITLADLQKKDYYDPAKGLPIPTPIFSGRLYLSFEKPVYIHVVKAKSGLIGPAEPDEGNTADPNYSTVWDKFEFTANDKNVLFSNTTCVDFVGIPLAFSVDGSDTPTQGFDHTVATASDPFGAVCQPFKANPEFAKLIGASRIFASKVNSENFAPFGNKDATYLDPYIHYCWAHYHRNTAPIEIWDYVDITTAENPSLDNDTDGKGCKWIAQGCMKNGNDQGTAGTLTFKVTKLYDKNNKALTPPSQSFEIPLPSSWDTFRQGGVFAPDDALKGTDYLYQIDGDIKNQVSSALNRNVMHGEFSGDYDTNAPAKGTIRWADRSAYYQENDVPAASLRINQYGKVLHALSIDRLCYALAYDDKYSQNVNLTANLDPTNPTVMKLMVYYQKSTAVPSGPMPSASVTAEDFLGGKYTVSIQPVPNDNQQVLIGITSQAGKILTNCAVMYPRVPGDADNFAKYYPGATTDNALKVPATQFTNGFRFVFRFEISGDDVSGRQYLIPANAAEAKGSVYLYDYTKTKTPLTTVKISNTQTAFKQAAPKALPV